MTEPPPADSPAMVTLDGSPPNWQMLSFTQARASAWSRMPALTAPFFLTSLDDSQPNAPS